MIEKMRAEVVERYHRWLDSRKVVVAVERELAHLELGRAQIACALENALMRLLIDVDGAPPSDLLSELRLEHLRTGFACIGLDDRRIATRVLVAMSRCERVEESPEPAIIDSPNYLCVGDYRLAKSAPVKRLLTFARSRMPEEIALQSVAVSALRYASIYAKTRHIGPPQRVYDLFHEWGVRNEGFASPFNARLLGKESSGFFSAFPQADAAFGARGSFFKARHREYSGAWCIDPPFLRDTLETTDGFLRAWQHAGFDPGVILIVPSWYEVKTDYDEAVHLYEGEHYYEGLAGTLHPLPTDVSIYRIGTIDGFDAEQIRAGYRPLEELEERETDVA